MFLGIPVVLIPVSAKRRDRPWVGIALAVISGLAIGLGALGVAYALVLRYLR